MMDDSVPEQNGHSYHHRLHGALVDESLDVVDDVDLSEGMYELSTISPANNGKKLELLEEGKASDDDDLGDKATIMEETDAKLEKEEESKKVHSVFGLVAMVFFLVCGGAYGTEDLGGSIPPLYALAGIIIVPWVLTMIALPNDH